MIWVADGEFFVSLRVFLGADRLRQADIYLACVRENTSVIYCPELSQSAVESVHLSVAQKYKYI